MESSGGNCVQCGPGTFKSGSMEKCELCPAGTFSDVPGATTCETCDNALSDSSGMTYCGNWNDEKYQKHFSHYCISEA